MDLATLWFFIVGVLFVGYFVLDGFDFGVGMSLPFLGKDEVSRRQVINTIGPVWDLNETWVIVAGACLFAAFPDLAQGRNPMTPARPIIKHRDYAAMLAAAVPA